MYKKLGLIMKPQEGTAVHKAKAKAYLPAANWYRCADSTEIPTDGLIITTKTTFMIVQMRMPKNPLSF